MSTTTRPASAHRFFSRHGTLSKWHPNYEFRQGQLEMAEAVESALKDRKHLIVEAGTGTGKTLAYLVPAILSGRRIVVSTGTKNLQEQLFYKDIPFLEQALFENRVETAASAVQPQQGPGKLSVCYMKGRNNYLCRKKLYDLTDQPVLSGLEEIEHYRAIAAWEKVTQTGDRSELASLPELSVMVSDQEASFINHPTATPPENQRLKFVPIGKSAYGPTRKPQTSASNFRWPVTITPPGTVVALEVKLVPMTKPGPSKLPWYGLDGVAAGGVVPGAKG